MTASLELVGPGNAKVYLTVEGERWRVYDTWLVAGKLKATTPPSTRATARVFVSESGVRKLCRFKRNESRVLSDARLAEQLRRAEYLATERFNPRDRQAR